MCWRADKQSYSNYHKYNLICHVTIIHCIRLGCYEDLRRLNVISVFCQIAASNVETYFSWPCLVSGLLSFGHPLVLLFFFFFFMGFFLFGFSKFDRFRFRDGVIPLFKVSILSLFLSLLISNNSSILELSYFPFFVYALFWTFLSKLVWKVKDYDIITLRLLINIILCLDI